MVGASVLRFGDAILKLSNLDKVLYPSRDFTKGDVISYYSHVAPVILPYLEGRPMTLKRYPDGVDGGFFYEKRCPPYKPKWVSTASMPSDRSGTINYCVIDSLPSLIWVANLASIELHPLLCKGDDPHRPLVMVFDLDPGAPAGILDCIPVAFHLREILEHAGLKSCVKTSGGKGLHLWVPLNTPVTFDQTKSFAQALARMMERQDPEHVTSNMSKAMRGRKVFIDWSQNDEHKTTAAAYSLRARAVPSVSAPVEWDELRHAKKRGKAEGLAFGPEDVLKRIEKKGDLFADVLKVKQRLPEMTGKEEARLRAG